MLRDNFLQTTSRILAERVGFLCSNPACRIHTVGPNQHRQKSTRIGEAAHITAAAPGGPRYDMGLTSNERKDIENGIWLCSNCADLIDKDERSYPTFLLKQWKVDAEAEMHEKIKGSKQSNDDKPTSDPFFKFGFSYKDNSSFTINEEEYQLSTAAAQLDDYISDISESLFYAKWLNGIEFMLWKIWAGGDLGGRLSKSTIDTLKILSERCGGWIFWHKDLHGTAWAPTDLWNEFAENKISEEEFYNRWKFTRQSEDKSTVQTFGLVDGYRGAIHQLKKELLFFDKLAVLNSSLDPFEERYKYDVPDGIFNKSEKKELLWLLKEGYVFPVSSASYTYTAGEVEAKMAEEIRSLKPLSKEYQFKRMVFNSIQLERRLSASIMPIFHDTSIIADSKLPIEHKKTQIVKLVINNLPEPTADTPWEKIIEFKNNEDAMGKFHGFQTIVNKLVKENFSIKEAYEEIQWNLYQYQVEMQRHKIRNNLSTLEKIVVTTSEIAENLVRLKFGQAAKTLFEARKASLDYDLLDTSFVGHELAYVYDVKKLLK